MRTKVVNVADEVYERYKRKEKLEKLGLPADEELIDDPAAFLAKICEKLEAGIEDTRKRIAEAEAQKPNSATYREIVRLKFGLQELIAYRLIGNHLSPEEVLVHIRSIRDQSRDLDVSKPRERRLAEIGVLEEQLKQIS